MRPGLGDRITSLPNRVGAWMAALSWVVGIVGFLLARDAAFRLWPGAVG